MIEPKWTISCLLCQAENCGECPDQECAKMHYDEQGNRIPADSIEIDDN